MRLLADFASRPSSRSRRVALRDGQRRRSRSAAVICRSFAYMSARLRRISAHCALLRGRRLPSGLPVAPQPEIMGAAGGGFDDRPAMKTYITLGAVQPNRGQTQTVKSAIVSLVADEETIRRKRDQLAAETYEYFWNICPELTEQWKQAMLTLPPSVLRDLAVEIQHLGAVTKWANRQLSAAAHPGAIAGGEPVEDLLDLASMENLREAADTMTRLLDELLKT